MCKLGAESDDTFEKIGQNARYEEREEVGDHSAGGYVAVMHTPYCGG